MLLISKRLNIPIIEVPIQTVYIDNNQSSHFNPIIDSLKIYSILIKYSTSSILPFIVDYTLFLIIYYTWDNILSAITISRSISLIFNFYFNKKLVFQSSKSTCKSFFKYLALAIFSMSILYFILNGLLKQGISAIWLFKIFIEGGLFFFNYIIQKIFIFR